MCHTDNLQSMMTTTKVMSIIELVFALALIIAGSVAASYSLPKWCEEEPKATNDVYNYSYSYEYEHENCESNQDSLNSFVQKIALWGTLPGIIPFVFGIFGIVTAMKKNKAMVGVLLAFTIVGVILWLIGIFLPFIGASIITSVCEDDYNSYDYSSYDIRSTSDGRDFCDRYAGSLWAIVVLNIILAILQFVFGILLCILCCANQNIWDQANGGAAPGIPLQPMGQVHEGQTVVFTQPANVPVQPAYGQPAQGLIPEATPVK